MENAPKNMEKKIKKQKQIVNSTTNSGLDVRCAGYVHDTCAMREVPQMKLFP